MTARLEDWLPALADRRPETRSVAFDRHWMTAGELEVASNGVARQLVELGCEPGDRVGLLAPHSIPAVVAVLAILKADGICVPLDPKSPAPRLGKILRNAGPRVLISSAEGMPRVAEIQRQVPEVNAAVMPLEAGAGEGSAPPAGRRSCDTAFLLYTSGSTGEPKGVMVRHAAVRQFVEWAVRYFGLDATDRLSGHPPLFFDLSLFDLFGSLAAGAELHIVPPHAVLLPANLVAFVRERRLTQWFSVPSVMSYVAQHDALKAEDFESLRRVLWCGEVLPTPVLRYWMSRLPRAAFTNLYGPTETTIASTYYTVPACPESDGVAIPIGRPCDGEQALVLDEQQQPVPPGEPGEICIGGAGLSPGYWNDVARTEAAFVAGGNGLPARLYRTGDLGQVGDDGLIYYLGRRDHQIKSRGYRIELGEIEAAVHALAVVREAAVVAVRSGRFDGWAICCAYVGGSDGVTPTDVKAALAKQLPSYMLPTRWTALDRLPQNARGKIDRPRIQEMFDAASAERTP